MGKNLEGKFGLMNYEKFTKTRKNWCIYFDSKTNSFKTL